MDRTIPELKEQIFDLLTQVRPEQLSRLDNEPDALRCLQDALMKTHDVLNLSSPPAGVAVKTATNWFACYPDFPYDQFSQFRRFRQRPAKSLDDLTYTGMPPSGWIVVGFTDEREKIVEGRVTQDGGFKWTYVAEDERREAADHLLETLTYPEGLSYVPMTREYMTRGSGNYEWVIGRTGFMDEHNTEWTCDILVFTDKGKVEMSMDLEFAEFSTEIISVKLDGMDIMPKNEQDDVDAPSRDNNSPDEDRGPEL